MFHPPSQYRRPRSTRCIRLLLALGNDDLVLHGVVDHVEFVFVSRLVGRVGVGGEGHDDAGFAACGRFGLVVDSDGGEVDVFLVDGGPAFHEVARDLWGVEMLGRLRDKKEDTEAYFDKPDSTVALVHNKRFVRIGLGVFFVLCNFGVEGFLFIFHHSVIHVGEVIHTAARVRREVEACLDGRYSTRHSNNNIARTGRRAEVRIT